MAMKILCAACTLYVCLGAFGGTLVMQTNGDGKFSEPSNWSPAQMPQAGDVLKVSSASGQSLMLNNDIEGLSVGQFQFLAGGDGGSEAEITVTGNAFTVTGEGNGNGGCIYVQYPRVHFEVPVILTAEEPYLTLYSRGRIFFNEHLSCHGTLIGSATPNTVSLEGAGSGIVTFNKKLSATNGFRIISGNYRCGAENVLDEDLTVTFFSENSTRKSSLNLEGFDQKIDRFTVSDGNVFSSDMALVRNTTENPCTLTMAGTGDGGTDALFTGPLSLVWNPSGDYTFVVEGGRASTMTGSIAVERGVFSIADGSTFRNVNSVSVKAGGKCIWSEWPFSTESFTLTAEDGASFWEGQSDICFPSDTFAVNGSLTLPEDSRAVMASDATVNVSGSFSFSGLSVLLTDFDMISTGTNRLFVVNGEVDTETCAEWGNVRLDDSCRPAAGMKYSFATESDDGKTSFLLVVEKMSPVAESVTYEGSQEGLWGGEHRSVFDGLEPKSVQVDADIDVGAIDFTADGYMLSGGGSMNFPDDSLAQVTAAAQVTATVSEVDFRVPSDGWLQVCVEKGGRIDFAQKLLGGGLWKTGGGSLVLNNPDNALDTFVKVEEGMLVLSPVSAIGTDSVTLAGGTLTAGGAVEAYPLSVTVETGSESALAIINAESDVLVTNFNSASGALLKRGGGTLTVSACENETVELASGNGNYDVSPKKCPYWNDNWSFDEDGTPATAQGNAFFAGLNIFEGALNLTGEGGTSVFHLDGGIHAGSGMKEEYSRQVSFSASRCSVDMSGQVLWLGSGIQSSNLMAKECTMCLVDAALSVETIYEGYQAGRWNNSYICRTVLTNSLMEITGEYHANIHLNGKESSGYKTEMTATNSHILARVFSVGGYGSNNLYGYSSDKRTFDSSLFGWKTDFSTGQSVVFRFGSDIEWLFMNGSVWHVSSLLANSGVRAVFTFDDAEWKADPDVFDFRFGGPEGGTLINVRGDGLKMDADVGQERNIFTPITGDGGFVKTGAGTVNFRPGEYIVWEGAESEVPTSTAIADPNTFAKCETNICDDATTARFTGVTRVLGGLLVFDSGTIGTDAVPAAEVGSGAVLDFGGAERTAMTLSGEGSVRNAAFKGGTRFRIRLEDDWSGASSLLFEECTFDGRVTVDFERDASDPLADILPGEPLVVGRYSGVAPDVSLWRLAGTGLDRLRGEFYAQDGVVSVLPRWKGFSVIVR